MTTGLGVKHAVGREQQAREAAALHATVPDGFLSGTVESGEFKLGHYRLSQRPWSQPPASAPIAEMPVHLILPGPRGKWIFIGGHAFEAVMPVGRRQRRPSLASCTRLQSRQLPSDAVSPAAI